MQIAMLSLHSCPLGKAGEKDTGGMNVYIRELSQELSKSGHYVDIFTNSHPAEHDAIIKLGNNVNLIHLEAGSPREMPKIALYSYLEKFADEMNSYAVKHRIHYDFIYSHYWLSGLLGNSLKQTWKVPQLSMFHTLAAIKNSIGGNEPRLRIEGEKNVVQNSDLVIASTAKERSYLVDYYGAEEGKISIVPCGVNLDLFDCTEKQAAKAHLGIVQQHIILYVGRLEPLKGVENLITAFGLVNNNTAELIIIGGDNHNHGELQKLQEMSACSAAGKNITFTGSLSQTELPLYYNAADVCVIPSYYESFGLVALESLACGTPVITTDVGDMRHIISLPAAGRITADKSPQSIAAAVTEYIDRNTSSSSERQIRRLIASRYGWGKIADMLLNSYKGINNSAAVETAVT